MDDRNRADPGLPKRPLDQLPDDLGGGATGVGRRNAHLQHAVGVGPDESDDTEIDEA